MNIYPTKAFRWITECLLHILNYSYCLQFSLNKNLETFNNIKVYENVHLNAAVWYANSKSKKNRIYEYRWRGLYNALVKMKLHIKFKLSRFNFRCQGALIAISFLPIPSSPAVKRIFHVLWFKCKTLKSK